MINHFRRDDSQTAHKQSQPASISVGGESTQAGLHLYKTHLLLRPKRQGWDRAEVNLETRILKSHNLEKASPQGKAT